MIILGAVWFLYKYAQERAALSHNGYPWCMSRTSRCEHVYCQLMRNAAK